MNLIIKLLFLCISLTTIKNLAAQKQEMLGSPFATQSIQTRYLPYLPPPFWWHYKF